MRFRVASYNVRNGRAFDWGNSWPFRRAATAATIESLDADIIGLQEVYRFQYRWLQPRLRGYAGTWAGRNRQGRSGEGCPLLVRDARARIVEAQTRWYPPGGEFPRIATTSRVAVDDVELQVVNTHLDAKSPDHRRASVEQLLGWLDRSLPQIVIGDFNAEPDDALFEPLFRVGLRHALPSAAGGSDHGFTGAEDGPRLDHVLVSANVHVVTAGVARPRPGGRLGSDHWPVVADLDLS